MIISKALSYIPTIALTDKISRALVLHAGIERVQMFGKWAITQWQICYQRVELIPTHYVID